MLEIAAPRTGAGPSYALPYAGGAKPVGLEKRKVGRYWLFQPLASGGMATVYLGCLRAGAGVSRPVAIKELHPHTARDAEAVERFLTEARIASRIRHPNVVAVLDVVAEGDDLLLVMEYVHGASLSQLQTAAAKAGEPIPVDISVRILVEALEGLHAAHEATNEHGGPLMVVHRDVSPQNIMVEAEGRARILDFGIAKALERSFTTQGTGEFRGKLAYAAPEQIAGAAVDRRTDVWGAGMVLWEILAGRRCFVDAEPAEIVRRITAEPVPPPSTVRPCAPTLDAIVMRALERDPDARFASAREMALALEKCGTITDDRTVSRWVRRLARTRLDDNRRMVDEMEAELRRDPPSDAVDAVVVEESVTADAPSKRGRSIVRPAMIAGAVVIGAVALGAVMFAGRPPRAGAGGSASATTPDATTGNLTTSAASIGASAPTVSAPALPLPVAPVASAAAAASAAGRTRSTARPRPSPSASTSSTSAAHGPHAPLDPLGMDERQ
ncbi:MAG: Protein kinase [Labilithrix sp.]|nr:Protein kinase [Labilithrix sp.]